VSHVRLQQFHKSVLAVLMQVIFQRYKLDFIVTSEVPVPQMTRRRYKWDGRATTRFMKILGKIKERNVKVSVVQVQLTSTSI
jgi:hypothetical protein